MLIVIVGFFFSKKRYSMDKTIDKTKNKYSIE